MVWYGASPPRLSKPFGLDHQAQPFAVLIAHNPLALPEEAKDRVTFGFTPQLRPQLLKRVAFCLKPYSVPPALRCRVQSTNPGPQNGRQAANTMSSSPTRLWFLGLGYVLAGSYSIASSLRFDLARRELVAPSCS
jgi:hypothetical protein